LTVESKCERSEIGSDDQGGLNANHQRATMGEQRLPESCGHFLKYPNCEVLHA
jgi:hypothetical protein